MNPDNHDGLVIVTDDGFGRDDRDRRFLKWEGDETLGMIGPGTALDIPNTVMATELVSVFDRLVMVRIPFPTHLDGRGFSIACHLRLLGFRGRLRAHGHVLADQYAMLRRCGFDEVEIDQNIARRQPEAQWLFRADWQMHDYQARLRARAQNPDLPQETTQSSHRHPTAATGGCPDEDFISRGSP